MVKVLMRDGRFEIFNENKVVGYVEDNKLYGFGRDGYAVEICAIDNNNEITTRFEGWNRQQ